MSISVYTTKDKFLDNLKDYCHFAKEGDCVTVTEWSNGDGFTVNIDTKHSLGRRLFHMSYGEFDALIALVNYRC